MFGAPSPLAEPSPQGPSWRLTPDEKAAFEHAGYLVRKAAFDVEEVAALARAFDRLSDRARGLEATAQLDGATFVVGPTGPRATPRVQRVVWCGAAEPLLLEAGMDRRALGPALDLLGTSAADHLVNQAHLKAPGDGVDFPLHQDAWNRRWGTALWRDRSFDGGYVQVLLTVDEMRADNGPLLVVPGSHGGGAILGLDRRARVEALAAQLKARPILAPPGSLVFFGPFLVHGSTPNESSAPRRALVNGFARPGVNRRSYPGAGLGFRRSLPEAQPR